MLGGGEVHHTLTHAIGIWEVGVIWHRMHLRAKHSAWRIRAMTTLSTEAKKAYFAKVRRSNYIASLRLEGHSVQAVDAVTHLPSREELRRRYGSERT